MKRYFIVADCHSFYTLMREALDKAGFDINNPEHIFVSLGDMFDRGDESVEMLHFLLSIPENQRIFIMGNHELLLNDILARGWAAPNDYSNGTVKTIRDITGEQNVETAIIMMRLNKDWAQYLNDCRFYAELGSCIFVHGWIPSIRELAQTSRSNWEEVGIYTADWRDSFITDWRDATWRNGMSEWSHNVREPSKTIFCGHWHTSWGHTYLHNNGVEFPYFADDKADFSPFIDRGIVAMDACTVFSHKVNCIVLNENELNRFPLF